MNATETVVFVHGLWMPGFDMALLRWRVHRCGYKVVQFHYSTVLSSPQQAALKLHHLIQKLNDRQTIHIIAHSLGGLVVRHLLQLYPDIVSGNIVTLGTPHNGSQIAELFIHSHIGRRLLGKSVEQGLLGNAPAWEAKNKLGVIAGYGRLGVGRFFKKIAEPFDGTVAVSETRLKGMNDHITMSCSHSGLLFNKNVAEQVCFFLRNNHFKH